MKGDDADASVALIGCAGLIPCLIFGYILRAWAIVTLWGWFVFPTWHIAIPSNKAALGLAILIGALSSHESYDDRNDEGRSAIAFFTIVYAKILLYPIVSMLIGWCVKEWM